MPVATVKICGVKDPATLDAVAEAGAAYVGFVFFPASPRAVSAAVAATLVLRHPGGPMSVGLFVDPSDDAVAAVLDVVPLGALQVHASRARAAALRARFGVPVWHAVGVGGSGDLPTDLVGVDRVLLDHKAPAGAALPGGNASPFEWSVLRGWSAPGPWILAGGLDPGNVVEAIGVTGATVVDVSSGVERVRGEKDAGLIRAFVAAAHGATGVGVGR